MALSRNNHVAWAPKIYCYRLRRVGVDILGSFVDAISNSIYVNKLQSDEISIINLSHTGLRLISVANRSSDGLTRHWCSLVIKTILELEGTQVRVRSIMNIGIFWCAAGRKRSGLKVFTSWAKSSVRSVEVRLAQFITVGTASFPTSGPLEKVEQEFGGWKPTPALVRVVDDDGSRSVVVALLPPKLHLASPIQGPWSHLGFGRGGLAQLCERWESSLSMQC